MSNLYRHKDYSRCTAVGNHAQVLQITPVLCIVMESAPCNSMVVPHPRALRELVHNVHLVKQTMLSEWGGRGLGGNLDFLDPFISVLLVLPYYFSFSGLFSIRIIIIPAVMTLDQSLSSSFSAGWVSFHHGNGSHTQSSECCVNCSIA